MQQIYSGSAPLVATFSLDDPFCQKYHWIMCFLWIVHVNLCLSILFSVEGPSFGNISVCSVFFGYSIMWESLSMDYIFCGWPITLESLFQDSLLVVNGRCVIPLWMAHHVVSFCEWPMWCLSVNGPCGVFLWMAHRPIICYLSVNGPSAHRLVSFCIVWYSAEVSCYLPERDDGNVVQICLLMDNLIICWWCQWVSDLGVYSINEWQFVNEWWMSLLSDC